MTQGNSMRDAAEGPDAALVVAAFTQTSENIRHVRAERIWFCNAYCAIVAGTLAILPRDVSAVSDRRVVTIGLIVLVLFSLVSLACSIRLVAELHSALVTLTRIASDSGIERLVGGIEAPRGFGATMPMRWVFPIFFSLTTGALLIHLLYHLLQ